MPVYEYWCDSCKSRHEILMSIKDNSIPRCPKCNQASLKRLFSTFRVTRSYKDVYDNILSDSQLTRGLMQNDPRALAQWNKQISGGEPVAPEYQETLERMERGEVPSPSPSSDSSPAD